MAKPTSYKPYLFLALALFVVLSLPKAISTTLRGGAAAWFSPLWEGAGALKKWLTFGESQMKPSLQENAIILENSLLKGEIARLQELLLSEVSLEADLIHLQALPPEYLDKDAFFRRRYDELQRLVDLKLNAVHAEVIFRGASSWTHTCFVNVGTKTNEELGRVVIAKNSPVTVGSSVIGIVDFVGEKQSLVRLITDPGLHPSVRVSRGYQQNNDLIDHINSLVLALQLRQGLLPTVKDQETLTQNLAILKKNLDAPQPGLSLAKGELCGAILPKWRSSGLLLRGSGFNYDFPDQEGPNRDLRSGKPQNGKLPTAPIIQVGDLLVTTGVDGVFPAGLHVAEVTSIDTLKEGGYTYEIEARPCASNIDDIKHVFILPPISSEIPR